MFQGTGILYDTSLDIGNTIIDKLNIGLDISVKYICQDVSSEFPDPTLRKTQLNVQK